ncbi:zinc finger and BTB domain-containing protein 40 [Aphelenchoides avenae]|nr:zinc finger and BTB domain-containing protein 40 [Aphelenchus avenae]
MEITKVTEKTQTSPTPPDPFGMPKDEEEEGGQGEDVGTPKKAKTRATCEECGRSCANARMLGFHKGIHLKYDERPYGCEECGRRYAYPSHLARHRRLKHAADVQVSGHRHVDIHAQSDEHADAHTQSQDEKTQAPVE